MTRDGECRSCHAPVLWAKTVAGKDMPLDPAPVDNGNINLQAGIARYVDPGAGQYVSHFATCPQGKTWRKGGKRS
jgi:hypothetical protein